MLLKILSKVNAALRHQVYSKIRAQMREGGSDGKPKYLTKEELQACLKEVDLWEIRNNVMYLFGLGDLNEPAHLTLQKAQVLYLSKDPTQFDPLKETFGQRVRAMRQSHQKFLQAILMGDVFPGLEK